MMKTQKELESVGFADTRTYSLASALHTLHVSIAQLDRENLRKASMFMPAVVEAARMYAQIEGGLNRFEEVE